MLAQFLLRLLVSLLVLVGLAFFNYKLARYCLGFKSFETMKAELSEHLSPVKKPLALADYGYGGASSPFPKKLMLRLGLITDIAIDLPDHHPELLAFSEIAKLNPYPPILWEVSKLYAYDRKFLSFLYLSEDNRFHQLTIYSGEASTTPSIFVPKVPETTFGGDYFVSYWILSSRIHEVADETETSLHLEWIGWRAYEGGSYNGFEEIDLNAALWAIELMAALVILLARWRRRRLAPDPAGSGDQTPDARHIQP